MATERQIAANQRNAQKSIGPRSTAGRKRSSQNALRHGLSTPISGADFEKQIEVLARQIAGDAADIARLPSARVAAEAQLELQRIRQLKAAMYERVMVHGDLEGPRFFRSEKEELRWIKANNRWLAARGPLKVAWPDLIDPSATMPKKDPDRSAEAARRLLPEFVSLLRYENRAAGRRDNAIRKMMRVNTGKF